MRTNGGVFEENRDKHAFAERGRKNAVHNGFREHYDYEAVHVDNMERHGPD